MLQYNVYVRYAKNEPVQCSEDSVCEQKLCTRYQLALVVMFSASLRLLTVNFLCACACMMHNWKKSSEIAQNRGNLVTRTV